MPAYIRIERALREKIEKGEFKIGDRLPSEEKLASEFKVSRMTLRRALSLLVSEGYLYPTPGRGTFITSPEDENIERAKRRQEEMKKMNKGVGILVPCITFSIFSGIVRGAEDTLREKNYHVILGNYDGNPKKEREYMETFVERGVSGFIISPNYYSKENTYYDILKKKGIPFVFTDITIDGIEADLVSTDNEKGGYIGTKHLISLGCKKIAFISGYLSLYSSEGRFKGYRKALKEGNIKFRKELVIDGDTSEEFGYEAAKLLFSKNDIDGIFSGNEPITVGILKFIKELNIKVPEEVKIVSFDEPRLTSDINYPITLIKQPRYEIGKIAAEILIERIKEKRKNLMSPFKKILLEPEISVENEKIRKEVRI